MMSMVNLLSGLGVGHAHPWCRVARPCAAIRKPSTGFVPREHVASLRVFLSMGPGEFSEILRIGQRRYVTVVIMGRGGRARRSGLAGSGWTGRRRRMPCRRTCRQRKAECIPRPRLPGQGLVLGRPCGKPGSPFGRAASGDRPGKARRMTPCIPSDATGLPSRPGSGRADSRSYGLNRPEEPLRSRSNSHALIETVGLWSPPMRTGR